MRYTEVITRATRVERIRIQRPRGRGERPEVEVLPPDPRDPDVVRGKARARAADSRKGDRK
jgi:hypothetical protein